MPSNALSFAGEGPPFDQAAAPETIVLAADRSRLRLAWPNGERAEVLAQHLREACRCAWCTRARVDGNFAASFEGIAIDRLTPIGDYAINVAFSDGHARGIYPWPYLQLLARSDHASEMIAGAVASAVPHDEPLE
jgi:prepilin-type processing-associated H-X9-DG protein